MAELIANQAAIAIYNARLFQELSERQETMVRLVDAGQSLSESIAQSEEIESKPIVKIVLDEIARIACQITKAACATIYPFDPTREEYYDIGAEGTWGLVHPLNLRDKPRAGGGMAERVKKEDVMIINDVTSDESGVRNSKFLNREGIKAFVGVAVHTEDTHLAVLYVSFRTPYLFTTEDVNTIRLFANQAGVSLQVARLLEKEQNARANLEMLALLNKIGSALSHRVIGIVGTTPVETSMIREYLKRLDVKSSEIEQSLLRIEGDNSILREMATSLKKLPELMGSPEPVDVNEVLSQIIVSNNHLYSSIKHHEKYSSTLPIVNVPKTQIKEVFENIIRNAIEHMPNDGRLTIETLQSGNGREIEVHISDTGPGMNQIKQEKIFELFYSEKKHGLGFGLWWSRTFMRKIGGDILVKSEVGKGSVFQVVIPYVASSYGRLDDNK